MVENGGSKGCIKTVIFNAVCLAGPTFQPLANRDWAQFLRNSQEGMVGKWCLWDQSCLWQSQNPQHIDRRCRSPGSTGSCRATSRWCRGAQKRPGARSKNNQRTVPGSHLWTHWLLLIVLPTSLVLLGSAPSETCPSTLTKQLSLRAHFGETTTTSHVMIWNHLAQTTSHTWVFRISIWLPCCCWEVFVVKCFVNFFEFWIHPRLVPSLCWSKEESIFWILAMEQSGVEPKNHNHVKVGGFFFQIPLKNKRLFFRIFVNLIRFVSGIWGANLAISPCCSSPNDMLHPNRCYSLYPFGPASCDSLPADDLPPSVSRKNFVQGLAWKKMIICFLENYWYLRCGEKGTEMCRFFCHVGKKCMARLFQKLSTLSPVTILLRLEFARNFLSVCTC